MSGPAAPASWALLLFKSSLPLLVGLGTCVPGAAAQRLQNVEAREEAEVPSAGSVFLASALLPGAGQYRLDEWRWVGYIAVEAWAWLTYADHSQRAERLEDDYRDLAWEVARRISVGRRVEGEFEYYETMVQYEASGAYDADPVAAGLQPESDAATFNGTIWALARDIYYPASDDPTEPTPVQREAALEYYRERAVSPERAWTWQGAPLERRVFAGLIRRSDGAARAATTFVGVILANHFLSAADALVTARLRSSNDGAEDEQGGLRLRLLPGGPGSGADRLFLEIEVAIP